MTNVEQSVRAGLTAPDAPFKAAVEDVLGVPMRVFKRRARSLRELLEGDLEAWCRETLASYKVPTRWELRSEPLPRNPSGKILKGLLVGRDENRFDDGADPDAGMGETK